ncbi:MAG TPA: hypothetical protein VIL85_03735 [Thermomicrobiales bacterium]
MLNYPLEMSFKIVAINPQVRVTDANGQLVAYVKQKAFKLKEDITIFGDEAQTRPLYRINANRILDFNANYTITTPDGQQVGSVYRPGARSIWKASYTISDPGGNEIGLVHEENAWVKVIDALAGEIPVLGMFTGYLFNPAYFVDLRGQTAFYLKKQPAFLEGKFHLEQRGNIPEHEEGLIIAGTIMALMLERMRG